ncbi:MAG: DNA methyltransferase [Thermodesulfobacteriota bacterium]
MYTGDRPNPGLAQFLADHMAERHDESDDDYAVSAFCRPIETTKNSHIFRMHGYHLGKKPYDAVQAYIKHYTREGDVVLDPFCGSGSTALGALVLGRKAVAIDVSPAATFITRFYVSACDPCDFKARFDTMCARVEREMSHLYGTVCHRCGTGATIHYVVYSNYYVCPGCGRSVSLFEASQDRRRCCPQCLKWDGRIVRIGPPAEAVANGPVAVNFTCHGTCSPKRMTRSITGPYEEQEAFRSIDLQTLARLESEPIPYPHPDRFMMNVSDPEAPWGDEWRPSRNFRTVRDLFTYRNFRALAALMDAAGSDEDLRAVITSGMLAASRKAQHLSGGGGYIPGNWALPPVSKQRNVLESLRTIFARTLQAKRALASLLKSQDVCISTQSAAALHGIPDCSVDYIFTDPPYGGSIQYGELNFIWEAWLGFNTRWHEEEIVVNRSRGRTIEDWAAMMRAALSECFRVLRPGRWLSLCWHDGSMGTWPVIHQILSEVGFVTDSSGTAQTIDTGANTYNQRVWDKAVKRDLVINVRKRRSHESATTSPADATPQNSFRDLARVVISSFLSANPGATKDRVYDHLVGFMFQKGRLEQHNFDKLLESVAERVRDGSRGWVLKSGVRENPES